MLLVISFFGWHAAAVPSRQDGSLTKKLIYSGFILFSLHLFDQVSFQSFQMVTTLANRISQNK